MDILQTNSVDEILASFRAWRGDAAGVVVALAPGRVNLVGGHTDYNDGFVLPMTLGHAVWVAARASRGSHRVLSMDFGDEATFAPGSVPDVPPSYWARYVGGMLCELRHLHRPDTAFEMLIAGDVPRGAGLSSSAALEMAVAVAVEDLAGIVAPPEEFARIGRRAEHRHVGVRCGIMDQMASRIGRRGHALFLDCRTLEHRHVRLPLGSMSVVIVDSGVRRSLATSKYNERRAECEAAVDFLRRRDPAITALRDVSPESFGYLAEGMPDPQRMRARHVVEENARVLEAVRRIEAGDAVGFGACLSRSHASLRDLYEVSCPEIDLLVAEAEKIPGVIGARITGGGFGGCTVNLMEKMCVRSFRCRIEERYADLAGLSARFLEVHDNAEAVIAARVV